MIKKIIRVFINKLIIIFNLKLIKNDANGVIDKRLLTPFQNSNEKYKLYFEGLNKSQNKNSDNFFKQSRHLDLMQLAEIILNKKIPGDFAEVGCWKGHSSYFISSLISKNNKDIKFHIFDSFEGLSESKAKDENLNKLKESQISQIRTQFTSSEHFVKNEVLKDFNFVEIYKGWIPEKFNLVENIKFSFVHIDVDLYEPTLQSLEFFFPRLQDGGIIVCDDYNSFEFDGAKKAWDSFFSKKNITLNFAPSVGGSFVIK